MKETYKDEIFIEKKSTLNFETNSILKKAVNIVLIPILNSIPKSLQDSLRRTHKSANEIIEHATTHKAIEILYVEEARHKAKTLKHKFFQIVWFNTNNSKALRNRLKLIKHKLKIHIIEKFKTKKEVKILNIASGSARGIIEVLERFSKEEQKKISVIFLDKSVDALLYSRKLVENRNISSNLEYIESTIGNYFNSHNTEKFDIIEIVGLLDYFDDEKVKTIFKSIYNNLNKGGVILAGNISDNPERAFVTNAVGWKMIYRSADRFINFLIEAGFEKDEISASYEPLGIHFIALGVK